MRKRIYIENHCYFITIKSFRSRPIFESDNSKLLYITAIDYCRKKFGFKLLGYVIMMNHVHLLIISPLGKTISDVMHHVNGVFANKYNKITKSSGKVIQRRFWEHVIRNQKDFEEKLNYIHNNPVKAGFVSNPEDWPYSSWHNYYCNHSSIAEIDFLE